MEKELDQEQQKKLIHYSSYNLKADQYKELKTKY